MQTTKPYKPRKRLEEGGPIVAYLQQSWADKLGDVPEGTPLTLAMFFRVMMRMHDIDVGKVNRPR